MTLDELFLFEEDLTESAVIAYGKVGDTIVKKYRCMSGPRKGRLVKTAGDCAKKLDLAKSRRLKRTMARIGGRIARRAKRTKRVNPTSKIIARKNAALKGSK